jgi:hypothetical protein
MLRNGWLILKRNVLRRIFGGIKVKENLRKRYNKELMQPFVDLDALSFVRINRLNWIGHVNRMHSKRNVSQLFKTILREVDEEDDLNR